MEGKSYRFSWDQFEGQSFMKCEKNQAQINMMDVLLQNPQPSCREILNLSDTSIGG